MVAEWEQLCDKRTFQEHDPQIVDDRPAKEDEQHRRDGMHRQPCRGVEVGVMEHVMPEIRAEQVAVMQQIDAKGRAGEQIDVLMIGQIHLGKINKQAAACTQSKDVIPREIKDALLERMMRYHDEIHQQIANKNPAKAKAHHFAGLVLEECMTVQPEIGT